MRFTKYVVVLAAIGLTGCAERASNDTGRPLETEEPTAEFVVRSEQLERDRFGLQMRRLLLGSQYDSLDHIAHDLRTQHAKWSNGEWKLRWFYIASFGVDAGDLPESQWKGMLAHLREWIRVRPNSITARVSLAEALFGYAWHGRGDGMGRDLTEAQTRLFHDRMNEASLVIHSAESLEEHCPHLVAAWQTAALAGEIARETYDSMVAAAVARHPDYEGYYFRMSSYLLPKWYGAPGEWEHFAAASADRIGGTEGDMLYARIVWYQRDEYGNVFKESSASWERTSRGYDALLRAYPSSLELKSRYARLAGQARDRARAKILFTSVGSKIDPTAWSSRDQFLSVRGWALQD